jgi:adenylate cyclase
MKVTRLLVAATVALLVSGIFSTPALDRVENLSLDSLFWLRHIAWGPRHNPNDSNAVVIAIDEETYRTAPFRDVPKVMWTKQIGEVLDSVHTAGASIIGFDIIFPTSVEPFIRGYDRDFMLSLRRAAKKTKLYLPRCSTKLNQLAPSPGIVLPSGTNAISAR